MVWVGILWVGGNCVALPAMLSSSDTGETTYSDKGETRSFGKIVVSWLYSLPPCDMSSVGGM